MFAGSGEEALEVLLFFPGDGDGITLGDKVVTLESRFASFHLSVKFVLRGALVL